MPKKSSVNNPVTNVNAMELSAPVKPDALGSHQEDPNAADNASHSDDPENAPEGESSDEADNDDGLVIPTRLKGKALKDVYTEFAGLEKAHSQQGNELGEARSLLRQTLESVIDSQESRRAAPADPAETVTDEEMSENPREAVRKLVKAELAPLVAEGATTKQKLLVLDFNERHPDYQQTARTPEFQEFVKASPYRTRLYQKAAQYDLDAAEDLYMAYEEHVKSTATNDPDDDDAGDAAPAVDPATARRRTIRQVQTQRGGAGGDPGKGSRTKVYKSTELARLYITDRDKYNEMMPEIKLAYREGRVK